MWGWGALAEREDGPGEEKVEAGTEAAAAKGGAKEAEEEAGEAVEG